MEQRFDYENVEMNLSKGRRVSESSSAIREEYSIHLEDMWFECENVEMNPSKSRRVSESSSGIRDEYDIHREHMWYSLRRLIWPVITEERENEAIHVRRSALSSLFEDMRLKSSDDDVTQKPNIEIEIEIGKYFDVVSLLSCNYNTNDLVLLRNNGGQVHLKQDAFKDKYLMICCFNVPVFRGGETDAIRVQALATLCSDLYARYPNNFEMIVVPKMHSLASHQPAFDHFLSGFPSSCLAVPFSYSDCRDNICNCLNLGTIFAKCLILDDASKVLYSGVPHFVLYFGAEAFPFTPEITQNLEMKDFPLWESHPMSTLEGLLQCDSSSVLKKTDSPQEEASISTLKHKVVGLYLFAIGDFLLDLNKVYEQCRAKHMDIEIVLVYMPFADSLDPQASQDKIDRLLHNHKISWWRVPYNNNVSRRLFRVSGSSMDDVLVILGPHDSYVDPFGREVMKSYGISGFPFTRDSLVELELKKLQELTLESLLVYQSRNYVFHRDEKVPVEDLRQRNVLVYFACHGDRDLYDNLRIWYTQLKQKDSSYEVVFIRRHVDYIAIDPSEDDAAARSVMPWLVCPFSPDHSNSVQEKLISHFAPHDILAQFGIDGHIRSVEAHRLLEAHGTDAFPFNDNLRQEVIFRLKSSYEFMRSY